MGALSHIRVLDLSRVLAGPWCTQMLADLGADVIKIERPGSGDDTRQWGPPFITPDGGGNSESSYFLGANRGKRSITLNLSNPRGQRIVHELVPHCDVLVENFKVGALARYRLDYETLKALNPRLVYCSITGFGQDGPYADRAGYDFMIQGMGGLMSVTGEAEEVAGSDPQKVGVAIADIVTGLYSTSAIQTALIHRERTGQGQYIDMALLDCQVAILANQAMTYLAAGETPIRMGNAHPNIVPYQVFETEDGHIILAVGNDGQFRRFCELAGRPEWAEDPRFAANRDRVQNRRELVRALSLIMKAKGTGEWLALLEPEGIPCGRINRIDETLNDPQVLHRQMRVNAPHSTLGEMGLLGSPLKLSATPAEVRWAPPVLGEHTNAVLREVLGYPEEQISALYAEGVV
ncbi:MAG TPA: CoA transferase [Gammaproteobacteria bacterium]|jgi:crotonobetainyl-CoA:carnitine CoA-transferase CaiB-like acyl-CoA transferase|nr:CoA transferase [Acidiferrobacteraceae bacterium]MDP6399313.1 CaiB/BaiF CoA-transferase family protein [Arenicellales bacterium]MDP6552948.1 CaiB/BaiF CoA-transferase family protein [Arenicellales bacterium]MDP6919177.1 CaiB/BaiF CoA-transferase family protein [Arenicellales bacterium]HCX87936.1 CoA transferase [Gammaproteobacteria bacterium]|tara:strand:- start:29805 stop:31022 length:1218 start_codon:yes stop_codon:yes gene_type:complete